MANQEDKQPGTNEFTGIAAVLVLFLSAVWVQYAPLTTSRPPPEEIPEITQTGVTARLWQDPFTAVQRQRGEPPAKLPDGSCSLVSPGEVLQKMAVENKDKDINIIPLGVMIQEASWASVEELQGRRQRYAVLAALNQLGYVPDDAEKLQCLEFLGTGRKGNPLLIPYERYAKTDPDSSRKIQVALFWLNELAFDHEPLRWIRTLFGSVSDEIPAPNVGPIRILGPWASGTVRDLVVEAQNPDEAPSLQPRNRLMFLSSSATAADEDLLRPVSARNSEQSLSEFLEKKEIFFARLTLTDDTLVKSLNGELALRGLDRRRLQAGKTYVALISEWDTLYAQTLPETFKRELNVQDRCGKTPDKPDECPILEFSYLRGLDGVLPGKGVTNADRQRENNKESKKNGTTVERPRVTARSTTCGD